MLVRRILAGLALVGTVVGVVKAPNVSAGAIPTREELTRDVQDLTPIPPAVGVPDLDPSNPEIPNLPYIQVPVGLNPALGVLGPVGVTSCQAAYLAPLGGVVAMTVLLDKLPDDTLPVQPSFLNPLFSPITTACVLAPFPRWTACKNDAAIQEQSEAVPAPFASLVVEVDAIQRIVSYYALNRAPLKGDAAAVLAQRLGCH